MCMDCVYQDDECLCDTGSETPLVIAISEWGTNWGDDEQSTDLSA